MAGIAAAEAARVPVPPPQSRYDVLYIRPAVSTRATTRHPPCADGRWPLRWRAAAMIEAGKQSATSTAACTSRAGSPYKA